MYPKSILTDDRFYGNINRPNLKKLLQLTIVNIGVIPFFINGVEYPQGGVYNVDQCGATFEFSFKKIKFNTNDISSFGNKINLALSYNTLVT